MVGGGSFGFRLRFICDFYSRAGNEFIDPNEAAKPVGSPHLAPRRGEMSREGRAK